MSFDQFANCSGRFEPKAVCNVDIPRTRFSSNFGEVRIGLEPRAAPRSTSRIGELVRELDTAQGARTELPISAEKKSKAQQIEKAGLTVPTALRYQELAGPLCNAIRMDPMLELEFADGKKTWVNCLMIRGVQASRAEGKVDVFFDATNWFTVKGTAFNIASEIEGA